MPSFTRIGNEVTPRSAAQMDTVLFLESSPNGSVGATGIHTNSTNFGMFKTPLGVQVIENARKLYDSATTKQKVTSEGTFDGTLNPNELVYLLSSLRGKVTPTVPTHIGLFVLNLRGGTGNFQLTLTGFSNTANIVHTADQDVIEDAMIAAFGRGCATVIQEDTGVFQIRLQGEYALGGVLGVTGIAGATCQGINPTGTGMYRYTFDLGSVDMANLLTFRAFQGPFDIALASKRFSRTHVSSLGFEISVDQAIINNGAILALPQELDQTILSSSIVDIALVNANPENWNFYYGSEKSGALGPAMMCNGFSCGFSFDGLIAPYRVVGCNTNSMKGVIATKPSTNFSLSVAQDSDSDAILNVVESGASMYSVLEWLGPEIAPGVPYRIVAMLPHIIEDYDPGEEQSLATYSMTGRIAVKNTLTPKIVIDCPIPAF